MIYLAALNGHMGVDHVGWAYVGLSTCILYHINIRILFIIRGGDEIYAIYTV